MAWSAPTTYIAGIAPTAAQLNNDLYHNMLETMPALSTVEDQFFISTLPNQLGGRTIKQAFSYGANFRTSTTYGTMVGGGGSLTSPSVTVTTDQAALVIWASDPSSGSAVSLGTGCCSVAVSGATTIAANDDYAILNTRVIDGSPGAAFSGMQVQYFTNLTPGDNTFTMHYRTTLVGESVFAVHANLIVFPF